MKEIPSGGQYSEIVVATLITLIKKGRKGRHLPDSCLQTTRSIDSLERTEKKKLELSANTVAFIGRRIRKAKLLTESSAFCLFVLDSLRSAAVCRHT